MICSRTSWGHYLVAEAAEGELQREGNIELNVVMYSHSIGSYDLLHAWECDTDDNFDFHLFDIFTTT